MKNEILSIIKNPTFVETGGGHNQKGIEFQRYWTIMRMIELEDQGVEDFLILVEAIQDVAEFDSSDNPKRLHLYQIKKRDRKEWTWNELTQIKKTNKSKTSKLKQTKKISSDSFDSSPIGKLFLDLVKLCNFDVSGTFISNNGCDLLLNIGGNAATSTSVSLNDLSDVYKIDILREMLAYTSDENAKNLLSKIHFEKVSIAVDNPRSNLIGFTHLFLEKRSPKHAGQARAFVDALMAIIGPLGTKTDTCSDFDELCREQGFTRNQFLESLSSLNEIPDVHALLNDWLNTLSSEGMSIMDITSIRIAAAEIYRQQVLGTNSELNDFFDDCDKFIDQNPITTKLLPIINLAHANFKQKYNQFTKTQLLAHYILRAIKKCADQI